MAVYNAGQYINTAIDSVLKQTFNDWELLIVNDGSIDNTGDKIKAYDDPRIKCYYLTNRGVSTARNVGLIKMSGDYFCFLDADDFLPPESLEARYQKLIQNPDTEFVDGNVHIYDHDLSRKTDDWQPSYQGNPFNQLLNLSDSCFWGLTWMIKRHKNKDYHFEENISHGEDLLFFIDLAQHGGKYDFVEDVILHYRKGHPSAMKNLKGLENGYHKIYRYIRDKMKIPSSQTEQFKKKARSVMFKSYIGNYQLINAILSLTMKW
jgi:glycosyltransferase involved in cell wall biosynthesis